MALTRKFLKAMGIEDEQVEQIIEAHSETVDALKEQVSQYKADAEKLAGVQKELDELKASDGKEDTFKVKYEAIKEDFENYKKGIEEKETAKQKETAYRALLKEAGISEKRTDAIVRVTDLGTLEIDSEGKLNGRDTILEGIKTEWADFITTQSTEGAKTATPPEGGGKSYKSKDEIMAIPDTKERQKAIAENHEMFGF